MILLRFTDLDSSTSIQSYPALRCGRVESPFYYCTIHTGADHAMDILAFTCHVLPTKRQTGLALNAAGNHLVSFIWFSASRV